MSTQLGQIPETLLHVKILLHNKNLIWSYCTEPEADLGFCDFVNIASVTRATLHDIMQRNIKYVCRIFPHPQVVLNLTCWGHAGRIIPFQPSSTNFQGVTARTCRLPGAPTPSIFITALLSLSQPSPQLPPRPSFFVVRPARHPDKKWIAVLSRPSKQASCL